MSERTGNENEQTRKTRERRKRQRNRLQRDLGERTGERDRARRDRDTLAAWIGANVPGVQVVREKSGRWFVIE